MPIEPVCVYYVITAPGGAMLDSGENTIGEVDQLRETLTEVFPYCTLHVMYPPRIGHSVEVLCDDCDQPAHCNERQDHRCGCPECAEGRREWEWEREHGI